MFCFSCHSFVQRCKPLLDFPESEPSSDLNIHLHTSFDFATRAVSDLAVKMESMTKLMEEICVKSKFDKKQSI